ncbi:MAG: hypothetical protein CFE44_14755 [Burkholderiales bacterium PBB4]|nr:MAG: hypothetical protein CFE44_14755 [Burkholderiales bacterium PBB4]
MLLIKTDAGQAAFKERSNRFSARQRSMFILVDGKKTSAQLLQATAGMGVTQADIDHLVDEGFLRLDVPSGGWAGAVVSSDTEPMPLRQPEPDVPSEPPLELSEEQRYLMAKNIATKLTANLGLKGFLLNLSVESASGYQALVDLFPQIQKAVGEKAARELYRALKG